MATEYINQRYYNTSDTKFIDIHQSVKCCIESWLKKLVFKNDGSRVIYAKPDISFRRRIELLDKGKTEDTELTPVSLNLPYASYSQEGDWEEDDRGWTQQAGQALIGQYDMNFYHYIRSLACKCKYKVTLFFSRRDDVRQLQQMLYWEMSPKTPTRMYSVVTWRKKPLGIPVNISIESVNTKPDYAELDWLEKQRIFPVEMELTIRSYQVLINNVDKIVSLPFRFQGAFEDDWEDETSEIIMTQETVLEWLCEKFEITEQDIQEVDNTPKYKLSDPDYADSVLHKLVEEVPNNLTCSIIKGYYSEGTGVDLNAYVYNEPKSTPTKAVISFAVKPADYKYMDRIEFHVPGHDTITVTNCKQKQVEIDGLYPNSTYDMIILTYSTSGDVTTFRLSFTTKQDENNQAPTPDKINHTYQGLVGLKI